MPESSNTWADGVIARLEAELQEMRVKEKAKEREMAESIAATVAASVAAIQEKMEARDAKRQADFDAQMKMLQAFMEQTAAKSNATQPALHTNPEAVLKKPPPPPKTRPPPSLPSPDQRRKRQDKKETPTKSPNRYEALCDDTEEDGWSDSGLQEIEAMVCENLNDRLQNSSASSTTGQQEHTTDSDGNPAPEGSTPDES